ncbi:hypothetical protein BC831DRAFT_511949 [Entophlyctis helioformis]|nr:hypothetical protein BC831DRAFT_511949 [Entophlyctis helioformis]
MVGSVETVGGSTTLDASSSSAQLDSSTAKFIRFQPDSSIAKTAKPDMHVAGKPGMVKSISFQSRSEANLFQQVSFSYLNDMIKEGSKRDLIAEDYPPVEAFDEADALSERVLAEWRHQQARHGSKAKLSRALWRVFGFQYSCTGLIYLLESLVKITQSYLLGMLLRWFESKDTSNQGYYIAAGLSASVILHALINQYKFFLGTRIGMQVRVALSSAIYKKCLRLSLSQIGSPGQIVNMAANDVQRFEDASGFAYYIVLGPLETLIILYFLYQEISWAAVVGISSLLLLLVPLQSLFAKRFASLRRTTNIFRDLRTKSLSDMLAGMIVVKLYAWELPFASRIKEIRNDELSVIRKASILRAVNEALFFASSAIISLATFVSFYLLGGVFVPSTIFTCQTFLQTVRMTMTNLFAKGMQFSSEAMVSMQRVEAFLALPEAGDRAVSKDETMDATWLSYMNDPDVKVAMRDASFSWRSIKRSGPSSSSPPPAVPAAAAAQPSAQPAIVEPSRINGAVLHCINLRVKMGELVGVCGPVGSGKTSLINAVLGELQTVSGHSALRSNQIGYVPQMQWIVSGTIRENILFGRKYRPEWFAQVVKACALDRDLKNMPAHDMTFLSERGATLSGGQRARISLARAVYADADVYLLDDPLSALDAQVGRYIFEHCIRGLLKKKAVLLVTHLLQYVEKCDQVLLLEGGSITHFGTFGRVASVDGSMFALAMREFSMAEGLDKILDASAQREERRMTRTRSARGQAHGASLRGGDADRESSGGKESVDMEGSTTAGADDFNGVRVASIGDRSSTDDSSLQGNSNITVVRKGGLGAASLHDDKTSKDNSDFDDDGDEDEDEAAARNIETLRISLAKRKSIATAQHPVDVMPEPPSLALATASAASAKAAKAFNTEDVMKGSVGSHIYTSYIRAGASPIVIVGLTVSLIVGQVLLLATDWWMSKWSAQPASAQRDSIKLYVYIGLAVVTLLVSILRAIWFFAVCLKASERLYSDMLDSVFGSPVGFFQANPHGRVLNRFSKDASMVDEMLPQTAFDFTQRATMIVGTVAIAAWVIPYVLLILPMVAFVFLRLRAAYVKASRQMKRLEATTRSPIMSAMTLALDGLALIRSFGAHDRFTKEYMHLQNANTQVYFSFMCAGRWLGLRLDILASIFFTTVAISSVAIQVPLGLSSATVGLLLSYVLQLVGLLQWAVRQSAEVENLMVSTERMLEYTKLPTENATQAAKHPDLGWPWHGKVETHNMWLQYPGALGSVLKNVSVTLQPGTKVGIVGRTGAGKSSFIQALFRLVEPSPEGSVSIDGIRTSDVGLTDLRSRLAIIPQEPFCFKGTLRFNLDPHGLHLDDELWRALDAVELKKQVAAMAQQLEAPIEESGSNWSVGERQLICLARALLRNSRIVVMDEATASVDVRTDQLVQKLVGADAPRSHAVHLPPLASSQSLPKLQPGLESSLARRELGVFANMSASAAAAAKAEPAGFANATVITIAHRLHTVIDYDSILVFNQGELVEQGPPWMLLEKDPKSERAEFAQMVAGQGPETQQLLTRLALAHKRISRVSARLSRRITSRAVAADADPRADPPET